jgi:hypothetical protein
MKFFGMVRAFYCIDETVRPVLSSLDRHDMRLDVKRDGVESDNYLRIMCTSCLNQPMTRTQSFLGLTFCMSLSPTSAVDPAFNDPWAPEWKYRALYFLYFIGIIPTMLLFWMLVSRKRFNTLLSSILPKRVIKHLANNEGVFSEELDNVTILFADICDFTPLASKLTPMEIVTMLDELYNMYDARQEGGFRIMICLGSGGCH